jgi:hypothetical protein
MKAMYHWKVEFLFRDFDAPVEMPPTKRGNPLFIVAERFIDAYSLAASTENELKTKIEITSIERQHEVRLVPRQNPDQ